LHVTPTTRLDVGRYKSSTRRRHDHHGKHLTRDLGSNDDDSSSSSRPPHTVKTRSAANDARTSATPCACSLTAPRRSYPRRTDLERPRPAYLGLYPRGFRSTRTASPRRCHAPMTPKKPADKGQGDLVSPCNGFGVNEHPPCPCRPLHRISKPTTYTRAKPRAG
jgi:hypothetical protein